MTFKRELESLLNKYSKENPTNTPDFILAEYLINCLHTFDEAFKLREAWYGYKAIDQTVDPPSQNPVNRPPDSQGGSNFSSLGS